MRDSYNVNVIQQQAVAAAQSSKQWLRVRVRHLLVMVFESSGVLEKLENFLTK